MLIFLLLKFSFTDGSLLDNIPNLGYINPVEGDIVHESPHCKPSFI